MRQPAATAMPRPVCDLSSDWSSGSAVFVHMPAGGRLEAGRVVAEGGQWRVWLRRGKTYRDRGTAPQRSAAVLMAIRAAEKAKRPSAIQTIWRARAWRCQLRSTR